MIDDQTFLTLEDLAVHRGATTETMGYLEHLLPYAPELQTIAGRIIQGTKVNIPYVVKNGRGSFRNANEGVESTKNEYIFQDTSCFFYDVNMAADEMICKANPYGEQDTISKEATGKLRGTFEDIGEQFYYGQPSATDKGFAGLLTQVPKVMKMDADLGAGNNGNVDITDPAAIDFRTSIYFICEGEEGVHFVYGGGDNCFQGLRNEWRRERIEDEKNRAFYAHCNNMSGFIGLQSTIQSAGIMHNVNSLTGLSDQMIARMLLKFRRGLPVTRILMTKEAAYELQRSRSATTERHGARDHQHGQSDGIWAQAPTESNNVPITITESIKPNEEYVLDLTY